MNILLNLLYSVLPKVLNKLAANPEAWTRAVDAVKRAFANRLTGQSAVEFFRAQMTDALEYAKNPTRMENFYREAALLYVEWKNKKV